jgi:hypothetical protein
MCLVADASTVAVAAALVVHSSSSGHFEVFWARLKISDVLAVCPYLKQFEKESSNIAVYELLAIGLGLFVHSSRSLEVLRGSVVLTDSSVALAVIEKRASRSQGLRSLLKIASRVVDGGWEVFHLPGTRNVLADRLSRECGWSPASKIFHEVVVSPRDFMWWVGL